MGFIAAGPPGAGVGALAGAKSGAIGGAIFGAWDGWNANSASEAFQAGAQTGAIGGVLGAVLGPPGAGAVRALAPVTKAAMRIPFVQRGVARIGPFIRRLFNLGSKTGLPATTEASVADKLERYLLNTAHPAGGPKARWFEQALGFTKENLGDLAKQIRFDPAKAVKTAVTEHGTKYNQVIEIVGANGRRINVTFAWIRNKDGVVRLVTAIPTPM